MPEGNTPAAGSNKTLYIIGGVVVLALVGWLFMRGAGFMMGAATGVNVDQRTDGSTTYTSDQGTVSVGANASMPENWPSDAPANFAGASIVYSGTSNPQTGQTGSAVSYTVRATTSSVADYYKQQLVSSGWTIQGTANMAGATVVSATKGTRTLGAYITDAGEGNVSVVVGIGM